MPLIQIFGILLISNDLAQYIGVNDEYDFVWYFGYGERFVGLLGNANGVSVGCSVAFAIWLILFLITFSSSLNNITGNLGNSMEDSSKSFRVQLTKKIKTMTTLVSGGALGFAFSLVALVAISIVSSIFQVSKSISY